MRKRAGRIIIALVVMIFICGCGKREVIDYNFTDEDTEEQDLLRQEAEVIDKEKCQKTIGHYTQEWNFTDENGRKRNVYVDADAMAPNVVNMEIVEVERRLMDDVFIKQIRKAYLGDEDTSCGYVGKIECTTDVFEHAFYGNPLNETAYYPKSLSEYPKVEQIDIYSYDGRTTDNYTNECKYSLAEAQAMAEEFLNAI